MGHNFGGKKWRNGILLVTLGILVSTFLAHAVFKESSEIITWQHSQFIAAIQQNTVESVVINPHHSQATVTTKDGTIVLVNLKPDPKLMSILTESQVEFEVSRQANKIPVIVAFPLLISGVLLISLLFWTWTLIDCATRGAASVAVTKCNKCSAAPKIPKIRGKFISFTYVSRDSFFSSHRRR